MPRISIALTTRLALLLLWAVTSATAIFAAVDPLTYPLGATLVPAADGGGAVLRVWAPNATSAAVRGQFNAFSASANPMIKDAASGVWTAHVANAQAGHQYKFFFSGALWRPDPRARDSGNLRDDNSILTDKGASYPWQATGWEIPDRDRIVIYELHIGSFAGNGDGVTNYPAKYRDVVDAHIDHLKRLNVNMVELMPVHEFNGDRSWGYNPLNFFAPESIYGSPNDLRYLIDTLHANGIGVILDVVYNHASTDTNLADYDGPADIYFYPDGHCARSTGYGSRPDYRRAEVRQFILDNIHMWMDEYRIDGFRFDLTSLMHGYCGEGVEGWNFLSAISQSIRAKNPRTLIIAEELPNLDLISVPIAQGGRGYDAQWGDAFHDVLRENMVGTNNGNNPNIGAIASVVAGSGFGRPAMEAVKFSTNHDEAGNAPRLMSAIDPVDNHSPRARGLDKIAGGLAILSPGIPMLFMGQEFHENKQFHDGRTDRLWWGFAETYSGVVDLYGALVKLRLERPSLRGTAGHAAVSINNGAGVFAFRRFDGQGDVTLVVANFSATNFTSYKLGAPSTGVWHELANSQSTAAGGNGITNGQVTATSPGLDGQAAQIDIKLPQYSLLVFSKTPLTTAGGGSFWAFR